MKYKYSRKEVLFIHGIEKSKLADDLLATKEQGEKEPLCHWCEKHHNPWNECPKSNPTKEQEVCQRCSGEGRDDNGEVCGECMGYGTFTHPTKEQEGCECYITKDCPVHNTHPAPKEDKDSSKPRIEPIEINIDAISEGKEQWRVGDMALAMKLNEIIRILNQLLVNKEK